MRLIDVDALIEAVENLYEYAELDEVLDVIKDAPTVDIPTELCKGCRFLKDCETCEEKLRPHGKWIFVSRNCWKCPCCQELTNEGKNFCPNCGADMRKGDET